MEELKVECSETPVVANVPQTPSAPVTAAVNTTVPVMTPQSNPTPLPGTPQIISPNKAVIIKTEKVRIRECTTYSVG